MNLRKRWFLTVCIGCNICKALATYVNVGCRPKLQECGDLLGWWGTRWPTNERWPIRLAATEVRSAHSSRASRLETAAESRDETARRPPFTGCHSGSAMAA